MTEDTLPKTEAEDVVDREDSPGDNAENVTQSNESNELVTEGDTAADYLEGLLDIIDLDGDIDIDVENDRAAVAVVEVNSGELSQLVGEEGKTLDALQELTRLAVAREVGHRSRLMLDVAGFRAQRREELQRIAASAVAEARAAQEPVRLDSMNAFERKVVHDAVAEAGLSSESEGSDPDRYVVISPA